MDTKNLDLHVIFQTGEERIIRALPVNECCYLVGTIIGIHAFNDKSAISKIIID